MNAKERSAAWAIDQWDPDNWIVIPEFKVFPKDVAFNGFAYPIVDPSFKGYGLRLIVREQVKTARMLIRMEYQTLMEVRESFIATIDLIDMTLESEIENVTRLQTMASFYMFSMQCAERACKLSFGKKSDGRELQSMDGCYLAIAECAECIRNLVMLSTHEKTGPVSQAIQEALLKQSLDHRRSLSEAGKLGAQAKHKGIKALKTWALVRAATMHQSDKEISRILSASLPGYLADVSVDPKRLIYDTLRASKPQMPG